MLDSGKIWAGLAILEDGFDQTAELHAVRPADILRREPELIERHRHYFPRLPLDHINVLVIDAISKTFSGTGMDTNVIGFRGCRDGEDLTKPVIHVIAALSLAEASQGNAIGVGLADFITRRLRDGIDEQKTFLNSFTTGHMERIKIPATFRDDEELFERIAGRYGEKGWIVIPNTLHSRNAVRERRPARRAGGQSDLRRSIRSRWSWRSKTAGTSWRFKHAIRRGSLHSSQHERQQQQTQHGGRDEGVSSVAMMDERDDRNGHPHHRRRDQNQ